MPLTWCSRGASCVPCEWVQFELAKGQIRWHLLSAYEKWKCRREGCGSLADVRPTSKVIDHPSSSQPLAVAGLSTTSRDPQQ
jgi:hypothetical protein